MKKKLILFGVFALCIVCLAYFAVTTYICGGENGYERSDRDYQLQEGEILHGSLYFHKKGAAPLKIEKISLKNENDIPVEVKIFFCSRQSMQMSGGPMKETDFAKSYSANLISSDQPTWIKNEDFQVVVITEEDKLEGVWVEIEYSALGMFRKKICSQELVI